MESRYRFQLAQMVAHFNVGHDLLVKMVGLYLLLAQMDGLFSVDPGH